jgi:hypothetical protein
MFLMVYFEGLRNYDDYTNLFHQLYWVQDYILSSYVRYYTIYHIIEGLRRFSARVSKSISRYRFKTNKDCATADNSCSLILNSELFQVYLFRYVCNSPILYQSVLSGLTKEEIII